MPNKTMNKFRNLSVIFAVLAMGMVACTNTPDDNFGPSAENGRGYKFTLNASVDTRALFDTNDLKTYSWEDGDALGIFIHCNEHEDHHIANNVKMNLVEEPARFEGTIYTDPSSRTDSWNLFAYYPFNSTADDRDVFHDDLWLVKHASRQTQIDAHHSNYDAYAFFSSENVEWKVDKATPTVTLKDRTAALRFLIKAGDNVPADLAVENLEEVDIFVTKRSTLEEQGLRGINESHGVVPLSGHFNFSHNTHDDEIEGSYRPIEGESRNYIEVDFLGSSTRADSEPFDIKITPNNSTYVWAVVPPFVMDADEVLVAIFNTASYKVVYAYERDGSFTFESNTLYNFKNVVAIGGTGEDSNIVSNDPVIHTNDYILGASTTGTTTGLNGQQVTYRYPTEVTFTMEADLPIVDKSYSEEGAMQYYIRYGFCDYCGADGTASHNGLDVPYSDAVEATVSWAHEKGYDYNYGNLVEKTDNSGNVQQGVYRLSFKKVLNDTEFLAEAFNGVHDPVYQAYAVYTDKNGVSETFYGHVVHVDMDPFVSDFGREDYTGTTIKTPLILQNGQFRLNIPSAYIFNGTAPAPYYWVNTTSSLRFYRCDISSEVNSDGSLKTETLEDAVAIHAATTEQLSPLQTINGISGFTGFYIDINTNGEGFIRYRQKGGHEISLSTDAYDDYNGAYCYVMQAYNKDTMELVWIRSEYFRLCEIKAASK